jgi:uncharacterized protein YkwD
MPVAHPPLQHAQMVQRVDAAVVRLLNRTRAAYGLGRLRYNRALAGVADAHSRDLATHGMLTHDGSDGTPFATRMRAVTRASFVGETLVEMPGQATAQRIVSAWMASPQHRAEILSSRYHRVGVGDARRGGATVVTADFTS